MATPFERLGGQGAVDTLIDRFYDKLLADSRMRPRFEAGDLNLIKGGQKMFWAKNLGSTEAVFDKDMRDIHTGLHVGEDEYEYTVTILIQTARELQVPEDLVAVIKQIAELEADRIVGY